MAHKSRRKKWSSNPDEKMVPVIGERVRAAAEQRGISTSELARRIGDPQATVDLIARGITKKCRRSRLKKIARVLNVHIKWLSGDTDTLPWASRPAPGVPTLLQLAESEIATRCAHAWRRDIMRVKREIDAEEFTAMILRWVPFWRSLVDPQAWQHHLLTWYAQPSAMRQTELTQAAEALATAFRLILEPWFKGKAIPEADGFVRLLGEITIAQDNVRRSHLKQPESPEDAHEPSKAERKVEELNEIMDVLQSELARLEAEREAQQTDAPGY